VAIAEQLYTAGARRGYCINDDISNAAKGVRCTNFNTKFTALGGTTVRPVLRALIVTMLASVRSSSAGRSRYDSGLLAGHRRAGRRGGCCLSDLLHQ
jgi:hypothetical protein